MSDGVLRLTKHHGAGNDFLVLLDAEGRRPLRPGEVVALCDRHRGVGADGMLRATRRDEDGATVLVMELYNADGSVAEMSGNGIRCLAQAAVEAGWAGAGTLAVDTGAGRRLVESRPGPGPGEGYATVAMGEAVLGAEVEVEGVAGLEAARTVEVGNPHLVLLFGREVPDALVAEAGARLERSADPSRNVEFVWRLPGDPPAIAMRVWERGVGETLACGTGAVAAAAAASSWGIAGRHVVVHNPGGVLEVELGEAGVVLGGATVRVCALEVGEDVLDVLVSAEPLGMGAAARLARARGEVDEVTAAR
jgi:diaminopimelate epimerase